MLFCKGLGASLSLHELDLSGSKISDFFAFELHRAIE